MSKFFILSIIVFASVLAYGQQDSDLNMDSRDVSTDTPSEVYADTKEKVTNKVVSDAEAKEIALRELPNKTLGEQLAFVFGSERTLASFESSDELQVALEAPYANGLINDAIVGSILFKAEMAFQHGISNDAEIEEISARVLRRMIRARNDVKIEAAKIEAEKKAKITLAIESASPNTIELKHPDKPMIKSGPIPTEDYDELKEMFEQLPNGYDGIMDFDDALKQMKIDMPDKAEEFEKIRKLK